MEPSSESDDLARPTPTKAATIIPTMITCASVCTPGTLWPKRLSEADDELSAMSPMPTTTAAAARTTPRKTIRSSPLLERADAARALDSCGTCHHPAVWVIWSRPEIACLGKHG